MSLLVPTVGENEFLKRMLNFSAPSNVKIHLYSNDVTISDASVIGDFTLITDPGEISLTGASWTVTAGTATYPQQTFTFVGAGTAYGYVVTDSTGAIVLFAETFTDGPYAVPAGGGTIKVTTSISLD